MDNLLRAGAKASRRSQGKLVSRPIEQMWSGGGRCGDGGGVGGGRRGGIQEEDFLVFSVIQYGSSSV